MTNELNTEEKDSANTGKDLIKGGLVSMEKLLKDSASGLKIYKEGDAVQAKIEKIMKNKVLVTIDERMNGIIGGKELQFDPQFAKGLKLGDMVTAYVVFPEDDDGNILLSLRKAGKENIWAGLYQKFEAKELVSVVVSDANKGGLIIELGGIKGFLPVSQLSAEHYPRVEGANKDEILTKLQQMVNKPIDLKILSIDKANNKLIFSEREAIGNRDIPEGLKINDQVTGKVTGIVDFGFFVDVGGVEGLVHISEISWAKVDDISKFVKVGDVLKLKIIEIENSRLSLSMKRLEEDPWKKMVQNLKVGDKINGVINKITQFGAFVKVQVDGGDIDALVHISEISSKHVSDPNEVLKVGENKEFKIVTIEPDQHRLSLSLKALEVKSEKPKVESDEKGSEEEVKEKKEKKAKKEDATEETSEKAEEVVEESPAAEATEEKKPAKKAKKK